jgi:hypothetical protein
VFAFLKDTIMTNRFLQSGCLLLLIIFLGLSVRSYGQSSIAETIATKIADKMRDSLGLNTAQRDQVLQVNRQLAGRKQEARSCYNHSDSLSFVIQQIEFSRDSLYRAVLTAEQMSRYKQKKRYLIANN